MSEEIDFFITLPSNDKSFPQAQQNPNDFKVRFPSPLNLKTEYQVALYEIFYNVTQQESSDANDIDNLTVSYGEDLPTDLFVYCDMIESQVVGSEYVRLLKHINNGKINTSQVFRASEPLQYVNVIAKHITQVALQINDQQGKPVPMTDTTTIVLAFRKRV